MKLFPPLTPRFDVKDVQTDLGYPRYYVVEEPIKGLIDEAYREAIKLIEPKGAYEIFACRVKKEFVELENIKKHKIESKKLSRHLEGCTEAIVFVVTIGPGVEIAVKEFFKKGELTRARVLDAVGSTLTEGLAEEAEDFLRSEAKKEGFEQGRRYSPGYGDWSLSGQKLILDVLEGAKLGIELTSSFMMMPRKSITAIVGRKKL